MGRNNSDFQDGTDKSPVYYRWMHTDEYESAKKSGQFKPNMNVSENSTNAYADDDRVHVKFSSGDARQKEGYNGISGKAYWLNNVPFEKSEVVDAGSAKMAQQYGFDATPRQGCLACEYSDAPLQHNHSWAR